NASVALTMCFLISPSGHRTVAAVVSTAASAIAVFAYAAVAHHEPFGYFMGTLVIPWLVWVPTCVAYSAMIRRRKAQAPLNKWLYIVAVVGACAAGGLASEPGPNFLVRLGTGLAVGALTYPAGMVGLFAALPPIYYGIATPSEAYIVASPVFAL